MIVSMLSNPIPRPPTSPFIHSITYHPDQIIAQSPAQGQCDSEAPGAVSLPDDISTESSESLHEMCDIMGSFIEAYEEAPVITVHVVEAEVASGSGMDHLYVILEVFCEHSVCPYVVHG
jgi:hypothetical protein